MYIRVCQLHISKATVSNRSRKHPKTVLSELHSFYSTQINPFFCGLIQTGRTLRPKTHLWLNSNVTHCAALDWHLTTMLEKLLDSLGVEAKAPERSQNIIWFSLNGASNLQLQLDPTCHKIKSDQQVEAAASYSNVKAGLVTVLLPFIILFKETFNNLDIPKLLANSITHLADTRKHYQLCPRQSTRQAQDSHIFSSVFGLQLLREIYMFLQLLNQC